MRPPIALCALTALAVSACSAAPVESRVAVSLSEWKVNPSIAEIPAGPVVFDVANAGTQAHEMLVVRSDAASDALPVVDGRIEESSIDSLGEVAETEAGASGTLRLEAIAKGHYILLCNVPGHYAQGMHADLIVR